MGNPLRIEDPERTFLITTRSMCSAMWFLHNRRLHLKILAFLARYQDIHGVLVYAFVVMGNHYHLVARFPRANMAAFMRDFNSMIAKLVATEVPSYPGGRFWARRYSAQVLPRDFDITHWGLYTMLNPLTTGVRRTIAGHDGYTSLHDCLNGITRKYKVFERWKFNEAKRYRDSVDPATFEHEHSLKFSKLPEFEKIPNPDYRRTVQAKVDARVQQLDAAGVLPKSDPDPLTSANSPRVGSIPKNTKVGTRRFGRPLVLSLCPRSREEYLNYYFDVRDRYRRASLAFRQGNKDVIFPPGTYRPVVLTAPR